MISRISFHPVAEQGQSDQLNNPVFSILIPSWNNLDYLKCCIQSIKKNSRYTHQLIVHVNEGKDGTLAWIKEQGIDYTYSEENVGVCYGFNAPAALAKTDYILLSDDDYYFAPDWDYYLLEEIQKLDHIYFCISGTMIEHSPTQYSSMIAPYNFGKTVKEFDEERFLREYKSFPFADWNGANWYPMVMHRTLWNLIGGLSTEFYPGMGSDPDMMMKLWHCGVRYYKGVSQSRVYHFTSRSTARVKKNDGNKQFLLKWGLSKSTFFDMYLRLGQPFAGYTAEPDKNDFRLKLFRDHLKKLFSGWK
ncbi:MAG TPA: glycosyltransferase family 2 protein [Cyclobacteriaceae bacterium]|nr:glycosyltransferase family 2 protein [Cyclobacteriaceae bacterium]